MRKLLRTVLPLLAAIALPLTVAAQARQGLLTGAPDPTGVAVKTPTGQTVFYVAATGKGIQLLKSTDLVHWESAGRVFQDAVPEWAKRDVPGTEGIWAPDLSFHDGLFYLYYSVSTFGSQHSVIGLAVNRTLDASNPDYKWEDRGKVIESSAGKTDFNAIDPALLVDEQGRWLLFWGSHWTGLKVVEVDKATGKPKAGAPIQAVAGRPDTKSHAIEAPFVLFHGGYYYLFVSWDGCCDGAKSTYKVAVGRSRNATGPYVDAAGKAMLEGGGTIVLQGDERWRGPGHNGVLEDGGRQYLLHHTYDVQHLDAQRILQIRTLTWGADGWPKVGTPVLSK
ncbi:MAG TPA: arabinan endo-1,5-alpha-L-arabinosidase [Luteitalea sp.]|nr:arabinan endo-1,5-alpha-L-arabinosidase [Luteitalea sp.]